MDDIAVVGIGLRFPGEATSPEQLWKVLERGESQWSEFPRDRLNIDGYFHPGGDRQGSISFRGAHFLKGDVAAFDSPFFSIAAEDAKAIDPQQRMLLEVSYEALENAGLRKEDLDGSDTAVYVGSFVKDYEQICLRDPDWQPRYAATGNGIAIMANRISHFFNFHGPSMTLDTGCSGSLVSVHLAAQSLRNGESSLALAAGSGMVLTPNTIMPMTALNFLSPDGKCFTFDARANGYGRGEGIGVVVMKRLSDALRDNDTIRAVIRGSAVNQDGRTPGITLPSKEAQVANIRSVYAQAGLDFAQTAYVECHGTGTQAGDWRELKAIAETLGFGREADAPVLVGSLKPNIGHLEGAAGVAGLIKGILVLEHGHIPPNINFETGNPDIDFEGWRVSVPRAVTPWPLPGTRRVSVNCFGFGGTNAHVILDEAPAYLAARGLAGNHSSLDCGAGSGSGSGPAPAPAPAPAPPQLFCFSSHERGGVLRIADAHLAFLDAQRAACSADLLRNYAYTLNRRRSQMEWKACVVASTLAELEAKLAGLDAAAIVRTTRDRRPRIGFVFCGQGAQWAQMGRHLLTFAAFRHSLEAAGDYMAAALQSPFDLLTELLRDEGASCLAQAHVAQPATTAVQVALVDLLASLGIAASHVVGHSSGEIAAAYAAGALSRQQAWAVAYHRGCAASSIASKAPKLRGGMMVVGMSPEQAASYLAAAGQSVQVACINSPRSVTISGQAEAIGSIQRDLRANKVFCRVLDVQVAYHSSHMRLVEDDYKAALAGLAPRACSPAVHMFSSVTGQAVRGPELDASYWAANMVSPVRYLDAVRSMMNHAPVGERPNAIIELSPRAALRSPTADILSAMAGGAQPAYHCILDPKRESAAALLHLVGALWSQGCPVDMDKVLPQTSPAQPQPKNLSDLPPYPWNHSKSYWHESHLSLANRFREYGRQDLIGAPTADSVPFEPRWRGFLRVSENPWIQDHQVQKTMVYPAAGMVCMVLEGARQMSRGMSHLLGFELTDVAIEKAMIIPNTSHGLEVAMNIKTRHDGSSEHLQGSETSEFAIYSKHLGHDWERNATGTLHFRAESDGWNALFGAHDAQYAALDKSCTKSLNPRQLYEFLDTVGMNYGPLFQNMTDIRKGHGSCLSRVRVPDTKSKMPAKFEYPHLIHPATLDSMFQTLFAIDSSPMVPTFIKSIFVSARLDDSAPSDTFTGFATAQRTGIRDADATIVMKRSDARVVIEGLHLTGLSTPSPAEGGFLPNHRNLCTEIVWKQDAAFATPSLYSQQVALLAHKHPALAVLQVGGGLAVTLATLQSLSQDGEETPRLARYTVVGLPDPEAAAQALAHVRGSPLEPFVEAQADCSALAADYHLIVVFDHAGVDADSLKKHLKAGGVILKQTKVAVDDWAAAHAHAKDNGGVREEAHALVNGSGNVHTDDGHGNVHTDGRHGNVHTNGNGIVHTNGNGSVAHSEAKPPMIKLDLHTADGPPVSMDVYRSRYASADGARPHAITLLLPREPSAEALAFAAGLERLAGQDDPALKLSSVSSSQVQDGSASLVGQVVVSLLDFGAQGRTIFDWEESDFDVFNTTQKTAKGIIYMTRGAHMKPLAPKGAPIVALARTLMSEDPLKTIVTFDLGFDSCLSDRLAIQNVLAVYRQTFCVKPGSEPRETEYAEEDGRLYVPRLVPILALNRLIEDDGYHGGFVQRPFARDSQQPGLRLTIAKPGISDGSFYYAEFEDAELDPGDVEIVFEEAPLTHLDLETVMGRTNESTIGMDVVGRVRRVGSGVTDVRLDDRVVALASGGTLQNTVRARAQLVTSHRPGMMPSFYLSAYHALMHVGRAGPGRRVLVQAGASAYGLAAVEIAMSVGAEVFATVLGAESVQQRETLLECGLDSAHILDADLASFVRTVQAASAGKGVDVVYNPTREHVDASFKCVRKCGTVVQFASKSPSSRAARLMDGSVTVVNFDLCQLMREDGELVAEMLERSTRHLASHGMDAPPHRRNAWRIDQLDEALKQVQQAPYLGYATLAAGARTCSVPVVNTRPTKPLREALDPHATYLLAGGLGGLGRSISELLVRHGARHLAYVSRSAAASSATAQAFLHGLRQRGVDARAYRADVCDAAALADLVGARLPAEMPAVKGVFQCAAVIKDAVFDNMGFADWQAALRPKTRGSWNLVQATATAAAPFVVFLASSAGVIGNRGQANYAAGNGFEDALARCCRLRGRRAVAVDLGPVLGAGMLAEDAGMLTMLRASGFYGIRHGDFLKVVHHAVTMETAPGTPTPAQVVLGVGTGGLLRQNQPADPYWSRTALFQYLNLVDMAPPDLAAGTDAAAAPARADVKALLVSCADAAAAAAVVQAALVGMLAKAMTMLPEELDANKPPNAYGVDSLVAVGVRNFVLSSFAVEVSVFDVLSDATIAELARTIADKGGYGAERA